MPCMYGDAKIADEPIGNFQGQSSAALAQTFSTSLDLKATGAISARDVKLELLRHRANRTNDFTAWESLRAEEEHRQEVDSFFAGLAEAVCASNNCDGDELIGQVTSLRA